MKKDVRSVCLALIKSRTSGSIGGRSPRPAALGWKLESGMVPAAELHALCVSVLGEMADAAGPRRWIASEPLRALMVEYHQVRGASAHPLGSARVARGRGAGRPSGRRDARPADCA